MDELKFKKLMENKDFVKNMFESKNLDELKSNFLKEGLEIKNQDLDQIPQKIEHLIEDEEFVKSLSEFKTPKELESIFSKKGLKVSQEELEKIAKSVELIKRTYSTEIKNLKSSGPVPLSEEEFEKISGGNTSQTFINDNTHPIDTNNLNNNNNSSISAKDVFTVTGVLAAGLAATVGLPVATVLAVRIPIDYKIWKKDRKRLGKDTSFKTYWKQCNIHQVLNTDYEQKSY